MADENDTELYTLREAAQICGIGLQALRRRVERGTVESVKEDGIRRISRAELERAGLWPRTAADEDQATIRSLREENERLRNELAALGRAALDPRADLRMSADARRAMITDAALGEFAQKGLYGTSTDAIASHVGISQPYLIRLFGSKKELFLAVINRGFDLELRAFRSAAERTGGDASMDTIEEVYRRLLGTEALLGQLQVYAACGDPDVRETVRARLGELFHLIHELTGATNEEIRDFYAFALLLNIGAALDLEQVSSREDWASALLWDPGEWRTARAYSS